MWLLEEKLCVIVFVVCVYHMSDMTSGKIACLAFSFSQPVRFFFPQRQNLWEERQFCRLLGYELCVIFLLL